jgi:chromosome segregation ATPase
MLEARDDDGLREIVDYLWSIALGIEDGDLSLTAQALRDAQEALRQALENGASDEEIARLTQELREAMQRFLQALAEEALRNPQLGNVPPDMDLETLRTQDLDRMLDRIEDLARSGARDAARQLLSELQNMLENLQAGMPMMGDPQAGEMMQGLNELGEMIRRQQQLMDQTHRADRGLDPNGESDGMTAEQLEQALRQLQQQQGDLQESLQELMEKLEGMGMAPNGKLGQAGEAMGDASDALGQGRSGRAVGSQGQALDALRQGAQSMAQQLANRGRGNGPGGIRGGDNFPNEDPLGRPQRTTGPDLGTQVKVPDEIDTQRAREILESIRRRLSEPTRPVIERDYLERLLDQF